MSQPLPKPGLPPELIRLAGAPMRPVGRLLLPPAINHALAARIDEGLLDFLAGRVVGISVSDLELEWRFTLDRNTRRVCTTTQHTADARIRGDARALLLLAARRADPDTLFFRRRLVLEGDTELGLQLKNVLDTIEPGDLPIPLARFLDHAGRMMERWS